MFDFKTRFTSSTVKGLLSVAALVIVTAVVLRFTVFAPQTTEAPPEKIKFTPIFQSTPQDIVGFEVKGRGEHISLTNTAQGWVFLTPENARVNPHAVYVFISTLCEWTPTRHLGNPSPMERQDPFGFEKNATVYSITRSDGKKIQVTTGNYDYSVGLYAKTGPNESYVMDKKTALESKGLLYFLRDHKVFPEPLDGIVRMNFRSREKVVTLSRTRSRQHRRRPGANITEPLPGNTDNTEAINLPWQIVYPRKFPANQQVVKEILELVRQWEAKAFVRETVGTRLALSRFGLIRPLGELTLHTRNNRYPIQLIFSSPPDNQEKMYLKTSVQSQIFEIEIERFLILEELFSHVTSQHLAYFLSQVAHIEILTDKWRVTIDRDEDLWEAAWQERLNTNREPQAVFAPAQESIRFFEGEILVEILKQAQYIDCLTIRNPLFPKYQSAGNVMKIIFKHANGKVVELFTMLEHSGVKEMIFLRCQQDKEVYLVVRSFYASIIKELECQLAHEKSAGTLSK